MGRRTVFQTANHIEAALWGVVGLSFTAHAVATKRSGRASAIAALTFLLFGASDIVEANTGAWWRPWWLCCWKSACVLSMITLFVKHKRGHFRKPK